jgi:hypothetical protein
LERKLSEELLPKGTGGNQGAETDQKQASGVRLGSGSGNFQVVEEDVTRLRGNVNKSVPHEIGTRYGDQTVCVPVEGFIRAHHARRIRDKDIITVPRVDAVYAGDKKVNLLKRRVLTRSVCIHLRPEISSLH